MVCLALSHRKSKEKENVIVSSHNWIRQQLSETHFLELANAYGALVHFSKLQCIQGIPYYPLKV